MPSINPHLESIGGQAVRSIEPLMQIFDRVSQSLVSGDPDSLEAACADLRRELAAWQQVSPAALKAQPAVTQKLQQLGALLSQQRAALARRSALVNRTLQSLLPAEQAAAYGAGTGVTGRGSHRAGAYTSLKA